MIHSQVYNICYLAMTILYGDSYDQLAVYNNNGTPS